MPTPDLARGPGDIATGVSGIVLAGGRGTRFGGDKLSTDVGGRALIDYPIAALSSLCNEMVVAIGPGDTPPPTDQAAVPIRVARDALAGGGPLVGLVAGLEMAREPIAIVAGGDMPALVGDVLGLLLRRIDDGAEAAALLEGATLRPLPCALRRTAALALARSLPPGSGLRDLLRGLYLELIPEAEWRALDPDGRTLQDVDTRQDLDRLRPAPS